MNPSFSVNYVKILWGLLGHLNFSYLWNGLNLCTCQIEFTGVCVTHVGKFNKFTRNNRITSHRTHTFFFFFLVAKTINRFHTYLCADPRLRLLRQLSRAFIWDRLEILEQKLINYFWRYWRKKFSLIYIWYKCKLGEKRREPF